MDTKLMAGDFGAFHRAIRNGESIGRLAKSAGLTIEALRRIEAGEVLPDVSLAYDLLYGLFGRGKDVSDAMLWLEAGWLGVEGRAAGDVYEYLRDTIGCEPDRHSRTIHRDLKALGITELPVRQRIVRFAGGSPGQWGRLVNGLYTPHPAADDAPDTGTMVAAAV